MSRPTRRHYQRWTPEEIRQLIRLRLAKAPADMIVQQLGRGQGGIHTQLQKLREDGSLPRERAQRCDAKVAHMIRAATACQQALDALPEHISDSTYCPRCGQAQAFGTDGNGATVSFCGCGTAYLARITQANRKEPK